MTSYANDHSVKNIRFVKIVLVSMAILLALVWAINPLAGRPVSINLALLFVGYLIYLNKDYHRELGVFKTKNLAIVVIMGLLAGIGFFLVTMFVPGLSLGYPVIPQAIGESLKGFLVIFVAPIVEEIVFRGAIVGFFTIAFKSLWKGIIAHAFLFAMFHLGAYIFGFYQLPDAVTALGAVWANISVFLVAFLYALGMSALIEKVTYLKDNLAFTIPVHMFINGVTWSLAIAVIL